MSKPGEVLLKLPECGDYRDFRLLEGEVSYYNCYGRPVLPACWHCGAPAEYAYEADDTLTDRHVYRPVCWGDVRGLLYRRALLVGLLTVLSERLQGRAT